MASEFTVDDKKYKLRDLSAKELKEADMIYMTTYSQALRGEILTRREVANIMVKRGQWSEEDDKNIEDMRVKVLQLEKELIKAKTDKKRESVAKDLKINRTVMIGMQSNQVEAMQNTAESLSEKEKSGWMAFKALTDDDGNQVFNDYDEFVNSKESVIFPAIQRMIMVNMGLDPDSSTPEDDMLKSVGRMDTLGYMTNKEGKLVNEFDVLIDRTGRRVNEDGFLINSDGDFIGDSNHIVSEEKKVKGVF